MLPTQKGAYRGKIIESGVSKSSTGLPQFAANLDLYEFLEGQEWQPCQFDITVYLYPVQKDGSVNEINTAMLEDSLGWDRSTGFSGLSRDWAGMDVQVWCDVEEYNGKTRMKAKNLRPVDYVPAGISRVDTQELRTLDQQFGSVFRATARKPAAKPANGNGHAVAKPSAQAPVSELDAAKRDAWDKFCAAHPGVSAANPGQWTGARSKYFKDRPVATLSVMDWRDFVRDGFQRPVENTIPNEDVFSESEIPF
jgi:hypothetical protein